MRNPDLPKLLRSIASSGVVGGVVEQAAIELEKLEKIYKMLDRKDYYPQVNDVIEVLNVN